MLEHVFVFKDMFERVHKNLAFLYPLCVNLMLRSIIFHLMFTHSEPRNGMTFCSDAFFPSLLFV